MDPMTRPPANFSQLKYIPAQNGIFAQKVDYFPRKKSAI
jgi:hypothetical protein